jgi:hypothetical protein
MKISTRLVPALTSAMTVAAGTRVPCTTGVPPRIPGFDTTADFFVSMPVRSAATGRVRRCWPAGREIVCDNAGTGTGLCKEQHLVGADPDPVARTGLCGRCPVSYRPRPDLRRQDYLCIKGTSQQPVAAQPASAVSTLHQFYTLQKKVTKLMKQNGVKMLAGSDLGGIWVIPGISPHQEFRELAAAGLTPLEVLQMKTLNGAQFLGREAAMGTVDIGRNADLVLLDANPIEDVANLNKIAAVVLNGKYLSEVALDKLKSDVAAAYAGQSVEHLSTVLDPSHVD